MKKDMIIKHCVITDNCRNIHGDSRVLDVAYNLIKKEFDNTVKNWPKGSDVKFHLKLSIERELPTGRKP